MGPIHWQQDFSLLIFSNKILNLPVWLIFFLYFKLKMKTKSCSKMIHVELLQVLVSSRVPESSHVIAESYKQADFHIISWVAFESAIWVVFESAIWFVLFMNLICIPLNIRLSVQRQWLSNPDVPVNQQLHSRFADITWWFNMNLDCMHSRYASL